MLKDSANSSTANFKSLLVATNFIVNNRARNRRFIGKGGPSHPLEIGDLLTPSRASIKYSSPRHIRVSDPNFPPPISVRRYEEKDPGRKISSPSSHRKKQGCASCMIYRPSTLLLSPLQLLLPTFEVTSRPLRFLRHLSQEGGILLSIWTR